MLIYAECSKMHAQLIAFTYVIVYVLMAVLQARLQSKQVGKAMQSQFMGSAMRALGIHDEDSCSYDQPLPTRAQVGACKAVCLLNVVHTCDYM